MDKTTYDKYSSFTVMKFTFLFGAFPVLLYGLKPTLEVSFSEIPLYVYGAILFVVVGATFLTIFQNHRITTCKPNNSKHIYIHTTNYSFYYSYIYGQ